MSSLTIQEQLQSLEQDWRGFNIGQIAANALAHIEALEAEKGKTHCEMCGCTWLDDGLNPIYCPYCKITKLEIRLKLED